MHISVDFVTECEKFLFQLKALQKRVQKDVNRFIVPQAVPEIYKKNERLKNRGMCFFVIDCMLHSDHEMNIDIPFQLYEDHAFFRDGTLVTFLSHILKALDDISVPVDPAMKKTLEQHQMLNRK